MAVHHVEGDELREPVWIGIRAILMEHWDPIGVNGEPFATNEYDNYIPKIKALLREKAPVKVIVDFLDSVATERMGFTSQRELARPAAERLTLLWAALEV
jgi:hypothetical protein